MRNSLNSRDSMGGMSLQSRGMVKSQSTTILPKIKPRGESVVATPIVLSSKKSYFTFICSYFTKYAKVFTTSTYRWKLRSNERILYWFDGTT